MKRFGLVLILLATVLIVAACSGNNADNGDNNASDNASNSNGGTSLELTASNFEFDKDTYTVQSGEEVSMSLTNEEGVHGAAIDDFDVDVADGEEATFTPSEPGEYEIHCSIPCGEGHDSMTSTLVVE